ncbi:T9SS type A sorting domain-containing protein [Winogradskyella sp. PG-2]|uniref:T9SS type A sorting domain-containing protein n=1 Tax=Winogradskyella sp. PG-2 TaxID=754409 RepID=UPI0004587A42|nr:T9SS type A sorting domain-containing protein [Winogradskyella sp. PG-2]BAO77699.1 hypothetical protein WPG_3469 [Winogradskyella sp. PG-2]
MKKVLNIKFLLIALTISYGLNAQITSYPYIEDFETGAGGWTSEGVNSSWQLGTPSFGSFNSAASGLNAWVTNLTGFYNSDENSALVSPEFDLSSLINPVVNFSLIWQTYCFNGVCDGAVLQSSIDNGLTWQNIGALETGLNGYNDDSVSSLPGGQEVGWSGNPYESGFGSYWFTTIQSIQNLSGESSVFFRIAFSSNLSGENPGIAFDDFSIIDIGNEAVSIPDEQFEQALIDSNIDSDGILNSLVNLNDIYFNSQLDILDYNIMNFEGLQFFKCLQNFELINNNAAIIQPLDFYGNMYLETVNILAAENLNQISFDQNVYLDDLTLRFTAIQSLDLTNNINLENVTVTNNPFLQFIDLRNQEGLFSPISFLDVRNNSNLNCVAVWNTSAAQSQSNWFEPSGVYVANLNPRITENPNDLIVDYDGNGNQTEVNEWLDINGGAEVNSCIGEVIWTYNVIDDFLGDSDFDGVLDRLAVSVEFTATDEIGESITIVADIIFNNFATAGESNGNGGVICDNFYDVSKFDDSLYTEPNGGAEYNDSKFSSSTFSIDEISGLSGLELEGTDIRFPESGAGQFTYFFEFKVSTSFNIGSEEKTYETSTFYTANDVTVAFDPIDPVTTVQVCDFNNLDLLWLYDQLEIDSEAINNTSFNNADLSGFNPASFWYNQNDNLEDGSNPSSLNEITEPGVYQFNAKNFLEDCAGEPIYVTLVSSTAETILIPDQQFEQALIDLNIDLDQNLNGQIEVCGISSVETLNINGYSISNFEGIQSFVNLEVFRYTNGYALNLSVDFNNNFNLRVIEIDAYVGAPASSGFNELILSNNTLLEELIIDTATSNLSSLDLSQNINLHTLSLNTLYGLQMIDLSNLNQLKSLYFRQLYGVSNLDLSNLSQLEELELIEFNQFSVLDISNLNELRILNLSFLNNITSLNFLNLSELEGVNISNLDGLTNLDFSNQSQLTDVNISASNIRAVNLQNGFNTEITNLNINPGFNNACLLVDDVEYAENNASWQITNSVYTDVLCIAPPINSGIDAFDANVNMEVESWLDNNGNAQVYFYQENITWNYNFSISVNAFNNIIYETTFTASSVLGNQSTSGQFILYTSDFTAGVDFVPVNEDVAGGIEADGALCADESGTFDLSIFNRNEFDEQIDFGSNVYENALIIYQQDLAEGTGDAVTSIEDTEVRFPESGAGQFTYHYTINVSKQVQYFGMPNPITLTDEADVWHWYTVPFNPGEDKEMTVCSNDDITLGDLYAQFDIIDGTNDSEFNTDDYWFDSNGNPITTYNGPGEYIFNAGQFLPQCGAIEASIIVSETLDLSLINPSEDLTIIYDPLTYETQVNTWILNNGGATASSCGDITWEWEVLDSVLTTDINPDDTNLVCTIQFTASDSTDDELQSTALLTFFGFPSAGLSIGNGGVLCETTSYDLNLLSSDDYNSGKFESSTIVINQTDGYPGATSIGTEVRFPESGAGQFTYNFDVEVTTILNIGGSVNLEIESIASFTVNEVTIPFDPGPNITVEVCDFNNVDLSALYSELEIQVDVDNTVYNEAELFGNVFEPENSWYNETDDLEANPDLEPLTEITEPGVYQFNAKKFLQDCAGVPVYVTLVEEAELSAGNNAELEICEGETPTEAELFTALSGDADTGGTWLEVSTGVYEYSHAATLCSPFVSATITLIEETAKSAGNNAELEICEGETPTEAELFTALSGDADTGGTWLEVSTGVYEYSHAATPCSPFVSATVTLIEETAKSAGNNAELEICEGETPTEAELFTALSGDADTGGTWLEVSTGVYEYSHAATLCSPFVSATITLIEETAKSAGNNAELEICEGETPTEAELFTALSGDADTGGTWLEVSTGVYEYSHAATLCSPFVSATVTLIEETAKSAGNNAELEICEGETPTEAELFTALSGDADTGGTWLEVSTGVYEYSHAATPCSPFVSATVTLIEETAKSAGNNAELEICEGETPTEAELFTALSGDADTGGTWLEVSTGVYEYSHAATLCSPFVSATVTLIEETAKSAGNNAELEICEGETPTEAELFTALSGDADTGGTWLEVSTGVYEYSHAATPCSPFVSATVTITEELPKSAGEDGELEICPNTNPSFTELFNALGGNPDYGGIWILASPGVYEYRHIATSCNAFVSAFVTLIPEEQKSAGEDGSILLCSDETPTEDELFAALGGVVDTGGTWEETAIGVYVYSHEPSSCYPLESATVTVEVNEALSPGEDGELQIEEGTIVIEEQLFNALEGTPDLGGVWSPELLGGGIYTYTHNNGDCGEASAIIEVTEVNSISNDEQLGGLLIYPNPSARIIKVKNEGNVLIYSIEIFAVNGQRVNVINSNFSEINISQLDSAMYFVKINSAVGIKMTKLIKN